MSECNNWRVRRFFGLLKGAVTRLRSSRVVQLCIGLSDIDLPETIACSETPSLAATGYKLLHTVPDGELLRILNLEGSRSGSTAEVSQLLYTNPNDSQKFLFYAQTAGGSITYRTVTGTYGVDLEKFWLTAGSEIYVYCSTLGAGETFSAKMSAIRREMIGQ
jgi:hypothetical protein